MLKLRKRRIISRRQWRTKKKWQRRLPPTIIMEHSAKTKRASKNAPIWDWAAELSEPSPPLESSPPAESPPPVVRTTREKNLEPPLPRLFAADFPSLSYLLLTPRNNYDSTCEPIEQFELTQSYSNVLFTYALLYVLGNHRLIDSLKALALYKLHKTLCIF